MSTKRNVDLLRNEPLHEYACIWAQTPGGVKFSRKITFEVCGSEEITISPVQ